MTDLNEASTTSLARVRPDCDVLLIGADTTTTRYVPLAANAALAVLLTGCISSDVSVRTANPAPVAVAVETTSATQIRGTTVDGTIVDMGAFDVVR